MPWVFSNIYPSVPILLSELFWLLFFYFCFSFKLFFVTRKIEVVRSTHSISNLVIKKNLYDILSSISTIITFNEYCVDYDIIFTREGIHLRHVVFVTDHSIPSTYYCADIAENVKKSLLFFT